MSRHGRGVSLVWLTLAVALGSAVVNPALGSSVSDDPPPVLCDQPPVQAFLAPAAIVSFAHCGQASGSIDGNSPFYWTSDKNPLLCVLTNNGRRSCRTLAPDLSRLSPSNRSGDVQLPLPTDHTEPAVYIEAVVRDSLGALIGFYHAEPPVCRSERRPLCDARGLMAPTVGICVSLDDGIRWEDGGLILTTGHGDCSDWFGNGNFIGGNGDFSAVLDEEDQFLYVFYTNYHGSSPEHGIAVARLPWSQRYEKGFAIDVLKWFDGGWSEPGLGGRTTAIIPAGKPWNDPHYDSFWGPAVHFNTYLRGYVMILNHTSGSDGDPCWPSEGEGLYLSYCFDIDSPGCWTQPSFLTRVDEDARIYPQIVGWEKGETDRRVGRSGRLFIRGRSWQVITFHLP